VAVPDGRRRCAGVRRALLVLTTAVALGACGSDTENHRGGGSERNAQHPGTPPPTFADDDGPGEIGGSHGEATSGIGAVDRHVLSLVLEPAELEAGQRGEIAFRVLGPDGEPRTRFELERTKQVDLILVSKDLRHFHHLHPEVEGTMWRARVRPEVPGDYIVIVDVKNHGRKQAVTGDLRVGGEERAMERPVPQARFREQHLVANQPLTLKFEAPGATEPYLGAAGHLVIIGERTLAYLHVDPHEGELAFDANFPQPGGYVMFLGYKRDGEVHWDRFAVTVS
jgi:hypothetical protein